MLKSWTTVCGVGAGGISPQLLGGVPWKGETLSAIPGLPKEGSQPALCLRCAVSSLHPIMDRYARLAMREFEWYQNLADEACAMPGTFAVFALGLEGEPWAPLVTEYLDLCDDEHSSLQEKFLHALIRKFWVFNHGRWRYWCGAHYLCSGWSLPENSAA